MDELLQWLDSDEATEYMPEICSQLGIAASPAESEPDYNNEWQRLLERIPEEEAHQLPTEKTLRIGLAARWAVAAAVLIICVAGGAIILKDKPRQTLASNNNAEKPIVPGTIKAVLITDNGQQITLDSSEDKIVLQGKNFTIQTNRNGQLVNKSSATGDVRTNTADAEVRVNTVATPPGGQYEVILPDGTKATLNAASGISYPTAFQGNKREVKITGEVYFEVAQNARQPFVVSTERNMQIEVLGTSFNVKAYSNEPSVKTTLLDGAVRVSANNTTQLLKPQQQAQLTNDGTMHLMTNVDVSSVIAWKNGVFEFNSTDIQSVMREISRWYNVDIAYEGKIPTDLFSAIINRQNSIDQVLTMLQNTLRVHFAIKNRTVYVTN